MGGKNMGYVLGPLQMALGAGALATGVGAPLGIPLLAAGAGETIGQGAGGAKGAGMGELFGGLAGGLGEGGFGLAGMGPMANMLSAAPALQSVAQNPAVEAIPAETVPLPGGGTMSLPPLAGGQQPLMGESAASLMTQDYPLATRLDMIPQYQARSSGGGGIWDALTGGPGAGAGSSSGSGGVLDTASKVAPIASAVTGGGGQQSQPQPPKPGFTGPIAQSPITQKGQAPATSVTPAVPSVPSAPKPAPAASPATAYQTVLGPQTQKVESTKPPITTSAEILKYLAGES